MALLGIAVTGAAATLASLLLAGVVFAVVVPAVSVGAFLAHRNGWPRRPGCQNPATTVTSSLTLFVLAAISKMGGAWLIWQGGVREHRGWVWTGRGVIAPRTG